MTKRDYQIRQEFIDIIKHECVENVTGGIVAATPEARLRRQFDATHDAELLLRHGKTYSRIQEAICNGVEWCSGLSDERNTKRRANHEEWYMKREAQLEKRIRAIVADLGTGFGVIFSGDPRGNTVKITVPSGRTNDFGREGISVPTS